MPDKNSNVAAVAHNVEMSIGRLDSLSTFPCVAAQYVGRLSQREFSAASMADILASDPALASMTLSLIADNNLSAPGVRFSFRPFVERLTAERLRMELLSVPVLEDTTAGGVDSERMERRKMLLLHSLAVGCCARRIAELTLGWTDPEAAYFGGLLHDLGKFAVDEAMPKSFARMVGRAVDESEAMHRIEHRDIGTDHTVLGKRLARKWRFPEPVINAIWLHHSDISGAAGAIPHSDTARVVRLADAIARERGIGHSGSCDSPTNIEQAAASIGIEAEQLDHLRDSLAESVRQKAELLGLDSTGSQAYYHNALRLAARGFAQHQAELSAENLRAGMGVSHLEFTTDFLLGVSSAVTVADIARDFAARWQKFYQTGKVCLYICEQQSEQGVRIAVVESFSEVTDRYVQGPQDGPIIAGEIAGSFAMLDARDHLGWLFDQLDTDFNVQRTKLIPLLCDRRAVGALAFELNYPGAGEQLSEKFAMTGSIGGAVLGAALAREQQERLVEQFVRAGSLTRVKQSAASEDPLEALAELAGGAAHELNNPLAVISGRAQLLAEAEDDKEKKEILRQIHENAGQASAIIEDLMSFAEPPGPRRSATDVRQIIEEAMQLAERKVTPGRPDIRLDVAEDLPRVFVDSAQIVSALANIIANAVESYGDEAGPVGLSAESAKGGQDAVIFRIQDSGCGMSEEVRRKATQPFFSAKPAGRKRGMGLAYASRFIQINGGSLVIESKPNEGTTVTVSLPASSR